MKREAVSARSERTTVKRLLLRLGTITSYIFFHIRLARYALPYKRHALRCKALELMHPGYLKKIQKADIEPVFIVGAGRSGNTLLARLLHETGGVHFGPENFTLCETYLRYLQCIDAPWEVRVDCILNILSRQEDSWRWEKVDIDAVRAYLIESEEHTLGNIIHAWYLYYGRGIAYPSERWGCKTPNLTPFMARFTAVFPNAKIIHIVRCPSQVVASFSKAGIEPYTNEAMAYVHWSYFNDCLKGLKSRMVLKFSDITVSPRASIDALVDALKLNMSSAPVAFDNPDVKYAHLNNVNGNVEKREDVTVPCYNAKYRFLEKKYESY